MRLSLRLLALGVCGPLAGLGIFLAISASTLLQVSEKAHLELSTLFDQDNRTKLMLSTSMIQRQAEATASKLENKSKRLVELLQKDLTYNDNDQPSFQGKRLSIASSHELLNPILEQPITDPAERASIFINGKDGRWQRLAGVDGSGKKLTIGETPPIQTIHDITTLLRDKEGGRRASNVMLQGKNGLWRMTRLTPLSPQRSSTRLVLAISTHTDAANDILDTSSSLIPYKSRQVGFFGFTPTGSFYCSYAKPKAHTCESLRRMMLASGGIPRPDKSPHGVLSERTIPSSNQAEHSHSPQRMFLATFPTWNWLAVIVVDESKLSQTLVPIQQTTNRMLLLLIGSTLLLISGCAIASWQIEEGIKRELQKLADAADGLANGRSRKPLTYQANDALGRLVAAFNRMAGAVADREASLRERIRTMEIDINQQALTGQICSITENPQFASLSLRAREMRARRQQRQNFKSDSASSDVMAS
jgi:HAMP domain-containing protein